MNIKLTCSQCDWTRSVRADTGADAILIIIDNHQQKIHHSRERIVATHPKCPICAGPIPDAEHEGQYPGAVSRKDNKTEICSQCGLAEAVGVENAAALTAAVKEAEEFLAQRISKN
jgi:hypothetical protein